MPKWNLTSTMKYLKVIFTRKETARWKVADETSIIRVVLQPERPSSHCIISLPRIALAEVSHQTFSLGMSYPNAGIFQTTNKYFYENKDIM